MNAAGWAQSFNGFRAGLPDDARETASRFLSGTGTALSSIVEKATGKKLDPDLIEQTVQRIVEDKIAKSSDDSGDGRSAKVDPADSTDAPKSGSKPKKDDAGSGDGKGT